MNPLERILIEKAGREHGFENVLPGRDDAVVLGSARHRVQVEIIFDNRVWLLKLPVGLLMHELERSFPRIERNQSQFTAPSIDLLTQLLSRAAALAQSLPNQAEIGYEAEVQKTLAKLPPRAPKSSAWCGSGSDKIPSAGGRDGLLGRGWLGHRHPQN